MSHAARGPVASTGCIGLPLRRTPLLRRNSSDTSPICDGVRLTLNGFPCWRYSRAEPPYGMDTMNRFPSGPRMSRMQLMMSMASPEKPFRWLNADCSTRESPCLIPIVRSFASSSTGPYEYTRLNTRALTLRATAFTTSCVCAGSSATQARGLKKLWGFTRESQGRVGICHRALALIDVALAYCLQTYSQIRALASVVPRPEYIYPSDEPRDSAIDF